MSVLQELLKIRSMKKTVILLFYILIGFVFCKQNESAKEVVFFEETEIIEIINENYELYKPNNKIKSVLILFGGYPDYAEDIEREFGILEIARANDIAVVLSNFNQKLWFDENEKYQLAFSLQNIFVDYQLPIDNVFIGGFSSGGTLSFLISDYIIGKKQFNIDPKGVFMVDSPTDLGALYTSCEKNIERNFSKLSTQESTWLIEKLRSNLGDPRDDVTKYEDKSVFTLSTKKTSNLLNLKSTKIRLYTEPDTIWWKKNRMFDFEQTNAFYIKKLSENLFEQGFQNVEYIPTTNKGYRSTGERHPHSWSIVDKKDLITWMLE